MDGQQGLICRDHRAALANGRKHEFTGKAITANELDHDIRFKLAQHDQGIGKNRALTLTQCRRLLKVEVCKPYKLNSAARALLNNLGISG